MSIYYIDYSSGNDNNNGTATGTPFKHCPGDANASGTAASTTLGADDYVVFKGGVTYSGRIDCTRSGTSGTPLTYISGHVYDTPWGAERAVIDGSGVSSSGVYLGTISVYRAAYLVFEGFDVDGGPSGSGYGGQISIYNDGNYDDIIIDNCLLHGGDGNGVMLRGLWNDGSKPSGYTIQNCEIYNNDWHGIQTRAGIDNVLVYNSEIHDNGNVEGNGVFAGGAGTAVSDGLTIRGCTIYDNHTKGHTNVSGTNILIEDNYMYSTEQIPFGLAIGGELWNASAATTSDVTIRNNIIDVQGQFEGAIRLSHAVGAGVISGVDIYNNYIHQRGSYSAVIFRDGGSSQNPSIENVTFKNNIVVVDGAGNDAHVIEADGGASCQSGFVCDYNHYYWNNSYPFYWNSGYRDLTYWKGQGFEAFDHTQDVDPDLDGDYKPNLGSPVIGAGIDLTSEGFTDDKDGVERGASWDIGALEYEAEGTTTTTTTTPAPTTTTTPAPTTTAAPGTGSLVMVLN